MAKIVITNTADFIEIDYGTLASNYAVKRKIRKTDWAETICLYNGAGIEIDLDDGNKLLLLPADVDEVDGNTTIDTDAQLYDALIAIM